MALKNSLQETQGHIQNEIDVAIGKLKADLNQVGDLQQSKEIVRLLNSWQQDKDELSYAITNYIGLSEATERSYLVIFRVVGYGLLLLGSFETVNRRGKGRGRGRVEEIKINILILMRNLVLVLTSPSPSPSPLRSRDTLRIDTNDSIQVNFKLNEKISQLQQVEEQVKQANSLKDVSVIFNRLEGTAPEIQDYQQLKKQLFTDISQVKTKLKQQAEETRASQHLPLVKNSIQWTLSAMVASFLFIWIWRATCWARFR